jgi:cytochrome c-type biogenesis protein CcmE
MEQPSPNASPDDAYKPTGPLAGQRKLYIALAVLGLALGYFSYIAFQGAAVFYVTVDELVSGAVLGDDTIRVNGRLVPDSFQRETEGTVARFDIAGGGEVLPAVYDGVLPELFFNEHSEIVLEGSYDSVGVFYTDLVIVKCPSKYEALDQEQQTEV